MGSAEDSIGGRAGSRQPLKVVIVQHGRGATPWGRALASLLPSHPKLNCRLVLRARTQATTRPRLTSRAAQGYVQFDRLQRSLRGTGASPEATIRTHDLPALHEDTTLGLVHEACDGDAPDLIVYLGTSPPPAWLARAACLGVVEPWDMEGPIGANPAPWTRELLMGEPVVTFRVMHRSAAAPADTILLHSARIAHRSISPAVNTQRLITRVAELMLMVSERRLHLGERAPAAVASPRRSPATIPALPHQPDWRRVAGQLRRRFLDRRHSEVGRWHLAYRRLDAPSGDTDRDLLTAVETLHSLETFDVLAPRDGSFWADPFVIEAEGRTLLFFEEQHGRAPGTIAMAELHPDGRLGAPVTLLSGPTHLSYPHVFGWDGAWWMIPESAVADEVVLYRCVELPDRWEREATLLTGGQLVDCTPFADASGRWWMFASRVGADPFPQEDLLLFSAPFPTGPWRAHEGNPLLSDVRAARPAGAVHPFQGTFLRPGQDCSVRYGYGLALQKVARLDAAGYAETELARILPPRSLPGMLGVHTFNRSPGLVCVDFLLSPGGSGT